MKHCGLTLLYRIIHPRLSTRYYIAGFMLSFFNKILGISKLFWTYLFENITFFYQIYLFFKKKKSGEICTFRVFFLEGVGGGAKLPICWKFRSEIAIPAIYRLVDWFHFTMSAQISVPNWDIFII